MEKFSYVGSGILGEDTLKESCVVGEFLDILGKVCVVVGFLDRLGKVCVVGGFSSCLLCPSHHSGGGSDRTAETLLNCGISFARHFPHQPFSGTCFPIFIFVFSQARIDSFTLLHLTWLRLSCN